MCLDRLSDVLVFAAYQVVMVYGLCGLASFWGFIHLRQAGDRDIPDLLFLALGLLGPMAGMALSFILPAALFVLPVCLGLLYWITNSSEDETARMQAALDHEDMARADAQIMADQGNAAAYWGKAEVCERQGRYAQALTNFRLAHELCDRMASPDEMADIEARLAHLMEAAEAERPGGAPAGPPRPRWLGLERYLFYVGLPLVLWNWKYALNVCAVMAFLRWLRTRRPAHA